MKNQLKKHVLPAPRLLAALLAGAALFGASAVSAATYGFQQITNNGNTPVAAQFQMETSESSGNVVFTIHNNGPVASTIAGVYFDWTTSLAPMSVGPVSGVVAFTSDPQTQNLPGGNTVSPVPFVSDQTFLAVPPPSKNGIDPSEWASFIGSLSESAAIADLEAGILRVGLHVISINDLGSESFVNPNNGGGPAAVPVPAAVWLFGSALAGFMTLSNRRKLS